MATFQGPLCAEPTVGMGWVVERIEHSKDEEEGEWLQSREAKRVMIVVPPNPRGPGMGCPV